MKKLKLFLLSVFLLFSFCIISQNNQTDIYAKAKAVKVKTSYKRKKNGNSYMVITGYTKKNKKVWSHTATSYTIAQAEAATYKKRKNKVYFFDRKKLKIYRLSNGKKIRQIKIPIGAGHDCAFDSKNNMYLTGYLYDDIYKIDPRGKILWKSSFKELGVGDAYGTSYKKGIVTVYFESSQLGELDIDRNYYVRLDASNGKVIGGHY